MKIAFYTSTFNDRPIEETLDFAREAGFDAIEIDIGGHIGAPDRLGAVLHAAAARGLAVAAVTLFGNQLDPDAQKRANLRARTRDFVQALATSAAPILVLFPGRDPTVSEDANYRDVADHFAALLTHAQSLTLAIENWPGPRDDYIATTPDGWRRLFGLVRDQRLGVEFDPSHLVRVGIDVYPAYDGVKDRVKIIHAKDTSIDAARLQEVGYHGSGWWRYRLPGHGMLDWRKFLAHAKASGFDGVVSVEHEDADFGWPRMDLALRKRGEEEALRHLRKAMAGS
jgi:sugar phosphate isomerase/epimerase